MFFHPGRAPAPYLAPPPSVQDPTTAQNEPVVPPVIQAPVALPSAHVVSAVPSLAAVIQAPVAPPPAHVESAVPSLAAPTTQRVTFESASSVPTSAQQQEKEQQSDDRKRDSPKKESKKGTSRRAKESRRESLQRNAKTQRIDIVAQKRSSNSVAQFSEVVANAVEEVTAKNAIREAAAERERENQAELSVIDNLILEADMELSYGNID